MNLSIKISMAVVLAVFAAGAMGTKVDLDYQRLNHSLDKLASNAALSQYAGAERSLARQAVEQLKDASRKRRPYALYMAERRVDLAKAAAELAQARHKLSRLQSQHQQILLNASRKHAAATRRELERERLQNQMAAEEAERLKAQGQAYSEAAQKAQAEAEQANHLAKSQEHAASVARHQAQLAGSAVKLMRQQLEHLQPHKGSKGLQMTLGGAAFASGQTALRPEARQHLGKLVKFVKSKPDASVRIEGYTDSSGNSAVNQNISRKRAQSVRDALVAEGVDASRISVTGKGESHPVASNDTAAGRAKNRRVVVILESK